MPFAKTGHYTIKDIYALPDGQRAELINGQIYNMAPPSRIHQELVSQFVKLLGGYIDVHKGNCKVYPAPFAVFLEKSQKNYVEPDVSVICDSSKLTDKGCSGSPDIIVEIVSPSSRKIDYIIKNALYEDAGVREYWIVDPQKETTVVYRFEEDVAPTIYPFDVSISFGIFPELTIMISKLLEQF
ncbi:Uma2 family endonuclease [Clostridiaceae bacterium]|nr:Uma2 family endonuclease [Clostridiaceae bacterium]